MPKQNARSFPWKCSTCYEPAMYPETIPEYSFKIRRGRKFHTITMRNLRIVQCRLCKTIVFDDMAETQLTNAIRRQFKIPGPTVIRRVRRALGVSVDTLADTVKITPSRIEHIEKGYVIPSIAETKRLKQALGLT